MSSKALITKDTTITKVIEICPNAAEIFKKYKMGCLVCMAASAETIEEGALMHDVDAQKIVDELNAACAPEN